MRTKRGKILGIILVAALLAILGAGLVMAQPTPPWGGWGGGQGMMGWGGSGGLMGGWQGNGQGGMMGGWQNYGPNSTGAAPGNLTVDQAADAAKNYLSAVGGFNLKPAEVMEFSNNFYVAVKEKDSGNFAMELLVDRYSGRAYPEMGPNMMWNTKYSPMANMMGWMMGWGWSGWGDQAATISAEQAEEIANQWLARYLPGTTAAEADAFYGYYTLHTERSGQVTGMLSVNISTGQVWYHTWHGSFVQMKELE